MILRESTTSASMHLHRLQFIWTIGAPMMRLAIEIQCFCVALIVTTQVWILAYFGTDVFEKLVGDEISLPMLYLTAIVAGTVCYIFPTYWRISVCLMLYSLSTYFAMMVPHLALQLAISSENDDILLKQPQNSMSEDPMRVWVPWSLGIILHMQFSMASFFVTVVCIRDMYKYKPIQEWQKPFLEHQQQQQRTTTTTTTTNNTNHSNIAMVIPPATTQNFISIEPQLAVITVLGDDNSTTNLGNFKQPPSSSPTYYHHHHHENVRY